jgi:hypothetical protein
MRIILGGLVALVAAAGGASAQTDYYNTDRGRPIRIEDAYPLEFRAVELQAAPLRIERGRGGVYRWAIEPELAVGIFPRTHIELGVPLAAVDGGGGRTRTGVAGLELSVLHNLNVETAIPALAVSADARFPVGSLGPDRTYVTGTGILTRTFRWARIHLNGQYTLGDAPESGGNAVEEASRWLAGAAIDKTFPLRALLLTAEVFAAQPIHADESREWTLGTGVRYQVSPRWAVDGGVGRRFTGADPSWYVTAGTAYAFGLPWRR